MYLRILVKVLPFLFLKSESGLMSILKDVCGENIDLRVLVFPGIGRETGLLAGMFQEGLAVLFFIRLQPGAREDRSTILS